MLDPDNLRKWAEANYVGNNEDIVNNNVLKETIFADMMKLANANKFNSLEKPK